MPDVGILLLGIFTVIIPVFGIGTFGAVIRIKDPILNKRQLLDVGAAGPIAGFVVALPLLAAGILLAEASPALEDLEALPVGADFRPPGEVRDVASRPRPDLKPRS